MTFSPNKDHVNTQKINFSLMVQDQARIEEHILVHFLPTNSNSIVIKVSLPTICNLMNTMEMEDNTQISTINDIHKANNPLQIDILMRWTP